MREVFIKQKTPFLYKNGRNNGEGPCPMTAVFVPIIRNKQTTERVFNRIGGLSSFSNETRENQLNPLVEITTEEDLEELHPYRGASDDLFVELPIYHYTTEEENDLADPVRSLTKEFGGQVGFYLSNLSEIDIPVISGSLEQPLSYTDIVEGYEKLSGETEEIAVRLFVSSRRLSSRQKSTLSNLEDIMSENEYLLMDIIEVGVRGAIKQNMETLSKLFSNQKTIVLNAFNAPEGNPKNRGPKITAELGLNGFGDFVLGRRFENSFPYTGPRKIRYYDPGSSEVVEYEGDDYSEAAEDLSEEGYLNSNHCEFCLDASGDAGNSPVTWSRIQKGHYVVSALNEDT